MWKTDYLGIHEKCYARLKAEGGTGWSSEDSIQEMLVWVNRAILQHKQRSISTVLELGCGAGDLSLVLAQQGFRVSGIDISPTAVEWADEKARNHDAQLDFRVGNVLDLPYAENTFDIVVDGHCFHCILGRDRQRFLSQAFRVLKPGGIFLIMTMCNDPADPNARRFFEPHTRVTAKNGIAGRYYGLPDAIVDEVSAAGFRILHQEIDWADGDDPQDELIIEASK